MGKSGTTGGTTGVWTAADNAAGSCGATGGRTNDCAAARSKSRTTVTWRNSEGEGPAAGAAATSADGATGARVTAGAA